MFKCTMVFSGLDAEQAAAVVQDIGCDVVFDGKNHTFFGYFDLPVYVVDWTAKMTAYCFSLSEKVQLVNMELLGDVSSSED